MISCLVLTQCTADNFAEDENYYDPTLPSPQFARTSLSLPHVYTEEDMDGFWTDSSETITRASNHSNNTGLYGSPGSNWGVGNNSQFGGPFSFFGGYGSIFNPWSVGNSSPWFLNNGWGYNNGWNSYHTGSACMTPTIMDGILMVILGGGTMDGAITMGGPTQEPLTPIRYYKFVHKTNYSGSRPTKYQSFRGSGTSKTIGSSTSTGWRGIIESATSLQESQVQKNVRSSYPRSNSASSYTTKRNESSKENSSRMYNDNNRSRSYQLAPERTNNSSRSYSPSPSRNTRTSNSNSSNSRRLSRKFTLLLAFFSLIVQGQDLDYFAELSNPLAFGDSRNNAMAGNMIAMSGSLTALAHNCDCRTLPQRCIHDRCK